MPAVPRRRSRLPVVSRLTLAWSAFGLLVAVFLGAAALRGAPELRLAMPHAPETLARPAPPPANVAEAPKTEATTLALREDASAPAPLEDVYADMPAEPLEQPAPAEDGGVVITIDGAPARDARLPAEPKLASLTPVSPIAGPDPALETRTPFGPRPAVGRDGRRASKVYARPFRKAEGGPKVALIVGGLGLDKALTERAIAALPADVTLAFAPYARDLALWSEKARAAGHEVMIEVPMESRGPEGRSGAVLGPAALLVGRPEADNLQRLDWTLSRLPAAFGATNYLGGKFSGDAASMAVVLKRLDEAGLAYVDDTGLVPGAPRARLVAPNGGGEQAARDLDELEQFARADGAAIGKAYVDAAALEAVAAWCKDLDARGLTLAPASALAAARNI